MRNTHGFRHPRQLTMIMIIDSTTTTYSTHSEENSDNESSSSHTFLSSSSDSDDEAMPPLPSTHDFVAALENNAPNQEISNNDSQSTTLSI